MALPLTFRCRGLLDACGPQEPRARPVERNLDPSLAVGRAKNGHRGDRCRSDRRVGQGAALPEQAQRQPIAAPEPGRVGLRDQFHEIRAVFDALRHERPIIAALWELLFYTAVRPGTALAARWSHIDLPRKVWEVPVTKKARGSAEGTGKPFIVPLSSQAIAVLKLLQPFSAHIDYMFPGGSPRRATADAERNLFSPQKSIQRVRQATGIHDLQMRDIRRTVATGLGKLKVTPVTISRVLDHTNQGIGQVTHVYARYDFLEEKREALELWGRHLTTVLKPKSECTERVATPGPRGHPQPHEGGTVAWRQASLLQPE